MARNTGAALPNTHGSRLASISGTPSQKARRSGEFRRHISRRPTPRGTSLPAHDVRLNRELAHRRFVLSLLRQTLRLVSLHALDALAVVAAALLAGRLLDVPRVVEALPSLVAFVLVGLNVRGSYRPGDARRDSQRLITGALVGLALVALPTTIQTSAPISGEFVLVFGIAVVGALIVERRIVDAIVHAAYVRGIGLRRAMLIARGDEYRHVLADITPHQVGRPAEDQVIVGYVTPESVADANALGIMDELEHALDRHDVSELIVATALRPETLTEAAEVCFARGVRILVLPAAGTSRSIWAEPTRVGRLPAYQLHPTRLELPALVVKRGTDLLLASLMLVLAVPLMAAVALAIKIESRGPVFFRQRRVGLGGRAFMMWKFRSMYHEAEARRDEILHLNTYGDERLFKLREDPRITKVGRLLRRFSMDELPQLFNILAGDMSLVGPRPPLPKEVETYEPRHMVRLSVVPGLTGPWQVNGRNLITDFEEVVRLEREYIESWSLRSDLEIILRTVGVVLSGKGAY
jgi:exopolysaccharide biosynthesis polyprenyl glycosylphosphotransferase